MSGIARFVLLWGSLVATPLYAEPISPVPGSLHITAGSLRFDHFSDDPFVRGTISGERFVLNIREAGAFLRDFQLPSFSTHIDPSFQTDGRISPGSTLEVDGTVLDIGLFSLSLRVAAALQPAPEMNRGAGFNVTDPFQLAGTLFGESGGMAYRYNLFGVGTGRSDVIDLGGTPSNRFARLDESQLSFEAEAASPVPEPGSLLLFATGALALARRACRRM